MEYFNIKRSLFIVPSKNCYAGYEKIDKIYDMRVNYIIEGNIPDHSVIGKFINKY